ncbi:unnamed protein product, partial [Rotaria socialis]
MPKLFLTGTTACDQSTKHKFNMCPLQWTYKAVGTICNKRVDTPLYVPLIASS